MNITYQLSNILVIGSGGAGLSAAIAAKAKGLEVTIIGKRRKEDAHTVLAAGGINAAFGHIDTEDSWKQHFADTMIEGYMLSEPRMVELMAQESLSAVKEIDEWGANFAKQDDGRFQQRYFGAHTYRRTCYSGDYTGRSILKALVQKASDQDIPIHEFQYVTDLLVDDQTCFGAIAFDITNGKRTVYLADAVILASGGHTRIWRKSSSRRDENTGDGYHLALKAGCRLSDMEMVQFHPTGMAYPEEMAGTLVTEAVRGEGGFLKNASMKRFMIDYDASRMELSTRDRVAMANYTEIIEGRGTKNGGVYLDISHIDKKTIIEKLPRMYRQFLDSLMIDISKKPMEVCPTAHYSMGGIVVDADSHQTNINGLYAAGEVTSGLHGANRLGGNSLAEILVFGKRAGNHASQYSKGIEKTVRNKDVIQEASRSISNKIKSGTEVARPLQRSLRDIMWNYCGVVRDANRLKTGLSELDKLEDKLKHIDVRPDSEGYFDLVHALDLHSSIISAKSTMLA
ncbi:FAD-dependent oxidoreductase, partial [Chlamydiia bacterium]|nr:FAD-dependent oxidoreductase [Chlamydiia bacterium]